jgi:hypothetical protein
MRHREQQRLQRIHLAARQRAPLRARHHRVDFLLDEAVHGGGGAGHQGDAERAGEERLQRHHARRGEEHADDRAEHDQGVHPRLGQAQVAAQVFCRTWAGGEDRFSHKREPPER